MQYQKHQMGLGQVGLARNGSEMGPCLGLNGIMAQILGTDAEDLEKRKLYPDDAILAFLQSFRENLTFRLFIR